jgi:Domain of unknown function (DUF4375)
MSTEFDAGRPATTWRHLLTQAPYFIGALMDLVDSSTVEQTSDRVKAAWAFDIFLSEIDNGGVTQYLYNQASDTAFFEQVPAYLALLRCATKALPLVREVHDVWEKVRPAVEKARESDDWPEALFKKYAKRFAALETSLHAMSHELSQALSAEIMSQPQDFFAIPTLDGIASTGVSYVVTDDGLTRLRFVDGFPIGPNLFDDKSGNCHMVQFNKDRSVLTSTKPSNYDVIHYPSMQSVSLRFAKRSLESMATQQAFWTHHGLRSTFKTDGSLDAQVWSEKGREMLSSWSQANGARRYTIETFPDGSELRRCYWANGTINTEARSSERYGAAVYSICQNEDGVSLAPEGTGDYFEIGSEEAGDRKWREGKLVKGLLQGEVRWMEEQPDGSISQRTTAKFKDGKQL